MEIQFALLEDAIGKHATFEYGKGVTPAEVHAAEAVVGRLPSEYVQFLMKFGWLSAGHHDFYGLGDDTPVGLELVELTVLERARGGLWSNLVPIMNNGGGSLYCFDSADGSGHVLFFDHETRSVDGAPVAISFITWALDLISLLPD